MSMENKNCCRILLSVVMGLSRIELVREEIDNGSCRIIVSASSSDLQLQLQVNLVCICK